MDAYKQKVTDLQKFVPPVGNWEIKGQVPKIPENYIKT